MCEGFDDGSSYLKADYSIDCASGEYTALLAYAFVMLVVYPIGTPCLCTPRQPNQLSSRLCLLCFRVSVLLL